MFPLKSCRDLRHGLSNNIEVLEHILRVYDESLARENVVAPQPLRKEAEKKNRKQLLKWDDVKEHDEVLTYVTGLSKGAREWLLPKLEKKVSIFFVLQLRSLWSSGGVFGVFPANFLVAGRTSKKTRSFK